MGRKVDARGSLEGSTRTESSLGRLELVGSGRGGRAPDPEAASSPVLYRPTPALIGRESRIQTPKPTMPRDRAKIWTNPDPTRPCPRPVPVIPFSRSYLTLPARTWATGLERGPIPVTKGAYLVCGSRAERSRASRCDEVERAQDVYTAKEDSTGARIGAGAMRPARDPVSRTQNLPRRLRMGPAILVPHNRGPQEED